jgi:hypothetical protein
MHGFHEEKCAEGLKKRETNDRKWEELKHQKRTSNPKCKSS